MLFLVIVLTISLYWQRTLALILKLWGKVLWCYTMELSLPFTHRTPLSDPHDDVKLAKSTPPNLHCKRCLHVQYTCLRKRYCRSVTYAPAHLALLRHANIQRIGPPWTASWFEDEYQKQRFFKLVPVFLPDLLYAPDTHYPKAGYANVLDIYLRD